MIGDNNETNIIEDDDPLIYMEVVMSKDSNKWLHAMKSKMDLMYDNQV